MTTLLSLVQTVQDSTDSDDEVVAVISHLLASGRVKLGGIFAGHHDGASSRVGTNHG
jgi:hypothetical protein